MQPNLCLMTTRLIDSTGAVPGYDFTPYLVVGFKEA